MRVRLWCAESLAKPKRLKEQICVPYSRKGWKTRLLRASGGQTIWLFPQPFAPESDNSYSKLKHKESLSIVASLLEMRQNTETQRHEVIEVLTSWCPNGDLSQQNTETPIHLKIFVLWCLGGKNSLWFISGRESNCLLLL